MTQKNYSVRTADGRDTEEIKNIFRSARAFMAAHGNPQWQDGYPYDDVIEDFVRGGNFRLIVCGGDIAAVYSVLEGDEEYGEIDGEWLTGSGVRALENGDEKFSYLAAHTLAVSPDFRGRGLARAAIREAEEEAERRGFSSVRLDTHECNKPMQALLSSEGFTLCGRLSSRGGGSFICFEKLIKSNK